MKYINGFVRQEVPASGTAIPDYYRQALFTGDLVFAVYLLAGIFIFKWSLGSWMWAPIAIFAGIVVSYFGVDLFGARISLCAFSALTVAWCAWFVRCFGWDLSGQNMVICLLALSFFNIYEPPWAKISYFILIVVVRMGLFCYAQTHAPLYVLNDTATVLFRTLNSLTPLVILAMGFIFFSSSLQETERELMINNQVLHREAGTDALTQLPNRRAMLDTMEAFLKESPEGVFSVAIADIDFFKKVNDTYGHNCGDYTLKALAQLMRDLSGNRYQVCRWGGEEFCIFMPELNLDQAGMVMHDLNTAVKHMELHYEGIDFSITVTIGVAENDFQSTMAQLLEQADSKLYRGKREGRNRVII